MIPHVLRWRGRVPTTEQQVVNARDSFVDLTPASPTPALVTHTNWSALLPGQTVPLIWEDRHGTEEE